VIAGRTFRYRGVVKVAKKREKVDADGLLPARLPQSVYVSNSGGYVVLN
jgi:hypothetical protein